MFEVFFIHTWDKVENIHDFKFTNSFGWLKFLYPFLDSLLLTPKEVLLLKDQITSCHEKLEKAPKQLALTEAVRRTFEKLTKEFHEECTVALNGLGCKRQRVPFVAF